MTEDRNDFCDEIGTNYEKWLCRKMGWEHVTDKERQIAGIDAIDKEGCTIQIKYDGRKNGETDKPTSRWAFEVAERRFNNSGPYVPSGIYKDAEDYVIGDHIEQYRIKAKMLRKYFEGERKEKTQFTLPTSRMFFMSTKQLLEIGANKNDGEKK